MISAGVQIAPIWTLAPMNSCHPSTTYRDYPAGPLAPDPPRPGVGASDILSDTIKTIAGWTPVGALITLFSEVLHQTTWRKQNTSFIALACVGS